MNPAHAPRTSLRSPLAAGLLALLGACTVKDPLFCDDTHPCPGAGQYCDRTGAYDPDHIKNSCVANPFDAMPVGPTPDAPPAMAKLSINTDLHDFHDVQSGTESFPVQFIVTNTGELSSGTIAVSVAGNNAGAFVVVPTGDASECDKHTLDAGHTCIVQVKYHAGAPGPETATLHVDADPGGGPVVALSGNSVVPGALEVTTGSALDFATVPIGTMSGNKTITVHNKGGQPCMNLAVTLNDTTQFTKVSSTCVATLAGNASCDVVARFNPTTVGSHASSFTITSDQGAVTPQLQGTGTGDVVVTKTGTGTITDTLGSPVISCGSTCTGTYGQTPITLHAATSGGIPFDGWDGACKTSGKNLDCTLPLTMATTNVTATFGVCVPGTGVCAAGAVKVCDSTGHYPAVGTTCDLGCADGTRCYDVDPTNGLAAALDDAKTQPAFTLMNGAQFDTSSGSVTDGNGNPVAMKSIEVSQIGTAVKIRVFEVGSLQMGSVKLIGGDAFAVVSQGDVTVTGLIDASSTSVGGQSGTWGPGAESCSPSTSVPAGGMGGYQSDLSTRYAGAGGGSFGGQGARGGNNPPVNGSIPGVIEGAITIHPLRGGCAGGLRATASSSNGGGGGAIQLVSRTVIKLSGTGVLHVGGAGAPGGGLAGGTTPGGGGGGSGGAILLEAPYVTVTGSAAGLAANGGGGSGACTGGSGQDGKPSTAAALGGPCVGSLVTSGGNGATDGIDATHGGDFGASTNLGYGGGGGGGVGRIRINTISSTVGYSALNGAFVSGSMTRGAVGTR
jgi:HYDIN/CFA65/VesB-like, Ig-like domain